jgi:RsiW-degrading membrane proteinase PrsW (M82 family)
MLPFAVPAFLENARDLELIGLVLGVIFWIQMIRYCATREAPSLARTLWLIFMILAPGVGSLLYFFLRAPRTSRT